MIKLCRILAKCSLEGIHLITYIKQNPVNTELLMKSQCRKPLLI
jgi:hypothetical protein